MNWFFIALTSTLCFSMIGHIDKYLISKYLRSSGIGALMLFSSMFSIFILPVIFFFERNLFTLGPEKILFLIIVGILSFAAIFLYFKALTYTDTSTIIPFFQLIPIFGFILGFILLKETIPLDSILAGLVIILGVLIISTESGHKKFTFKKSVFFLMFGSSFLYALYEVLFKVIAIEENFLVSFFWQNVGLLISGVFLYFFVSSYRKDFHELIINNGYKIFSLNLLNEALNTAAVILIQYSSLLAPIVLVMLVNALQPSIVFIIGILITLLAPKIAQENLTKRVLLQKMIAILIIFCGAYFLYT